MRRSVLPLFLAIGMALCPLFLVAQDFVGFDDFLRQYEVAPPDSRLTLAQSFVKWQQARGGFPIRQSGGDVVFVYIGDGQEKDVRLTGDFRQTSFSNVNWDNVGEPMERIGTVFYRRRLFEPDARLDYKFIVDGKDRRAFLQDSPTPGGSLRFAHRGLISFTPSACKPAARKGCAGISPFERSDTRGHRFLQRRTLKACEEISV